MTSVTASSNLFPRLVLFGCGRIQSISLNSIHTSSLCFGIQNMVKPAIFPVLIKSDVIVWIVNFKNFSNVNGLVIHSCYLVFDFWWYSLGTHWYIWYSFKISDAPAFACDSKKAIAETWHFSDPDTLYFMIEHSMYFHCSNYSFDLVASLT